MSPCFYHLFGLFFIINTSIAIVIVIVIAVVIQGNSKEDFNIGNLFLDYSCKEIKEHQCHFENISMHSAINSFSFPVFFY